MYSTWWNKSANLGLDLYEGPTFPKLGLCDSNLSICKTNLGLLQHISSAYYYIYTLNNSAYWIMVYFKAFSQGDRVDKSHLKCHRQFKTNNSNQCFHLFLLSFHPVSNLSQPGTFAGNDAIVAFARSQQMKVVIHQLNMPLWEVSTEEDFRWHHAQLRCLLLAHLPVYVFCSHYR